jgi:uncharacterized protein with GYD domain
LLLNLFSPDPKDFKNPSGLALRVYTEKERSAMPTYVVLMKLTDQGIRAVKDSPDRIESSIKHFESMGGKFLGFYATMGQYDYVAIGEAANEAIVMAFVLGLGRSGDVRTTTLKALSREEFEAIVSKLP